MPEIKNVETRARSADIDVHPEKLDISEEELELEHALANYVPDTDVEKRLVRKMDLIMMPTLWFMYILAYIDRQNIVCTTCDMAWEILTFSQGNAKVAGMDVDLNLTDGGMWDLPKKSAC